MKAKIIVAALVSFVASVALFGASVPGSSYPIIDSSNAKWTITTGGVVQRNGVNFGFSQNAVALLWCNSRLYQENNQNLWWYANATTWVSAPNPGTNCGGSSSSSSSSSGSSTSSSSSSSSSSGSSTSSSSSGPAVFGFKRSGNHLVSTLTSATVIPIGMNMSGCETPPISRCEKIAAWGATNWKNIFIPAHAGTNTVRLPITATTWLNVPCNGVQPDPTHEYPGLIEKIVTDANTAGLYVIIDEHWSAPIGNPVTCAIGQPADADKENSIAMWQSVSGVFKGNPAVAFELFNEPFGSNVYQNWVITQGSGANVIYSPGPDAIKTAQGGAYTSFIQQNNAAGDKLVTTAKTWNVAGELPMLNAIRAGGADNLILLTQIGWSGEIEVGPKMYVSGGDPDPDHNAALAMHCYAYNKGTQYLQDVIADGYPLVITEFTQGTNLGNCGGTGFAYPLDIGTISWGPNAWGGAVTVNPTGW